LGDTDTETETEKSASRSLGWQQDDAVDAWKLEDGHTTMPTTIDARQPRAGAPGRGDEKRAGHTSLLSFLHMVQFGLRLVAILWASLSLYLILSWTVAFSSAKKMPGDPLASLPGSRETSTRLSTAFVVWITADLVVNFMLAVVFCCWSNKVSFPCQRSVVQMSSHSAIQVQNNVEALGLVVAGIAVGFVASVLACSTLKNRTGLPSGVW
jgi:hypothetical protein